MSLKTATGALAKAAAANLSGEDLYSRASNYYYGTGGCAVDQKRARGLYLQAAELGHAAAMGQMGYLCSEGIGGPVDSKETVRWTELAAGTGNATAQCNLGVYHETGRHGLPLDRAAAIKWYKMAADQADAYSIQRLEILTGDAMAKYGEGAKSGDPAACYELGMAYYNGRGGLDVDKKRARELLQISSEKGNGLAQQTYGYMLSVGEGGPLDSKMALEWTSKSADGGNPISLFNMGVWWETAKHTGTKDLAKARGYYAQAAAQGHKEATEGLERLGKAGGAGAGGVIAPPLAKLGTWDWKQVLEWVRSLGVGGGEGEILAAVARDQISGEEIIAGAIDEAWIEQATSTKLSRIRLKKGVADAIAKASKSGGSNDSKSGGGDKKKSAAKEKDDGGESAAMIESLRLELESTKKQMADLQKTVADNHAAHQNQPPPGGPSPHSSSGDPNIP